MNQKGFTIAEIIIALSILSFGIVLVYGAFSTIVVLTNNLHSRFAAAYLAQEGLEIMRNIRDDNFIDISQGSLVSWAQGLVGSPCNLGCMADYKTKNYAGLLAWDDSYLGLDEQGFYSYQQPNTPTIFKRKILVTPVLNEDEALNVSVTVYWDYNGTSYTFEANENLYNWY